jgi:hypothetical protein
MGRGEANRSKGDFAAQLLSDLPRPYNTETKPAQKSWMLPPQVGQTHLSG